MSSAPLLSLIVPTRKRPRELSSFLNSVRLTADRPERIEVLLVIDADDPASLEISCEGLDLRRVVVPSGLAMGALNMAGYEASTGRYLMLLNDDVTVRTRSWDTRVLECFQSVADDILLVHVNDNVFKQALCTFPIVSRRFCDMAGGICPRDYVRYRIDDHIEDVFNLLGVLGERRSVYLPDVVFEHANYVENKSGLRQYFADETILALDAPRFEALRDSRKELTLRLRRCIENHRLQDAQALWSNRLEDAKDAPALRRPERLRVISETGAATKNASVTVAVLTTDSRLEECRACVNSIQAHGGHQEFILLEVSDVPGGRAKVMNRLLRTTESDYLVVVEDDALVGPGWLESLLRSLTPQVAMAAPLHSARQVGEAWGGVAFYPDGSGHHGSISIASDGPNQVLSTCGATFLLDLSKCRRFFFDERQHAYYLEIDFGLKLWEAGFEVVWASTVVTHLADGTPPYGGALDVEQFEHDRRLFAERWFQSGRFERLRQGVWDRYPHLTRLLGFDAVLESLSSSQAQEPLMAYHRRVQPIIKQLSATPILRHAVLQRVATLLNATTLEAPEREKWNWLRGLCGVAVLVEAEYLGHRLTLCGLRFYATPEEEGDFDPERYRRGAYRTVFAAESLEILKERIQRGLLDPAADTKRRAGFRGAARLIRGKMAKVRACVGEVGVSGLAKIVYGKTARGLSRLWQRNDAPPAENATMDARRMPP